MPTTTAVKTRLRLATLALSATTGIAMLGAAAPAQATGFTVGSHIKATSALLTQVGAPVAEQWYGYNKFGSPRATTPGTSPHGFGISIDFQENDGWSTFDWGQPGNRWLLANSKKYGFGNPFPYGTWGESYHFDFQG